MRTFLTLLVVITAIAPAGAETDPIQVVTTLPTYAWLAREVGGEAVEAVSIARGNQDAHFVEPRPSYAVLLKKADLFVTTGLDLELWAPTLLDKAGNRSIREGQPGYVAAHPGVAMLDVPASADRAGGDVHIFGNPHLHTSPLNAKIVARNIAEGLKRVAPREAERFDANLRRLEDRIDRALFGDELVDLLGGSTLASLAAAGRLLDFLEQKEYRGRPLVGLLGGWLGRMAPHRGSRIICYHKNWIYFTTLFGLEIVDYVEPKPGIPPTPRHLAHLIDEIGHEGVRAILAANYFEASKPRTLAERTGVPAIIVSLEVGGEPGTDDYFRLVDNWVGRLADAFEGRAAP
jgi:ABC-type Zn uptake system ZnuABC Zn-binding protein ZnuA